MKENRDCVMCSNEFRTKTTSKRKTCCTDCSRKYRDSPKVKQRKGEYHKEYVTRPEVRERRLLQRSLTS